MASPHSCWFLICALSLVGACSKSGGEGPDEGSAGGGGAGSAGRFGGVAGGAVGGWPGPGGAGGRAPSCAPAGNGGPGFGGNGSGGRGLDEDLPCPTFTGRECPADGALCGNGTRDTCIGTNPSWRCPQYSFTEVCDGDAAGLSCRDLGFGSGTVGCTATCTADTSGCSECITDAPVVRCGAAPVTTVRPLAMAMAATDAEVALAWLEPVAGKAPTLQFARLSPSLDLVSATPLADEAVAAATAGLSSPPLAVAPLPSGWVVVGYAKPDLFVHVLDATGHDVARWVLANIPDSGPFSKTLVVAERAGGGPLILWYGAGVARGAVVAADGRSATTPITLPIDWLALLRRPGAIFNGSAFYVAFSLEGGPSSRQMQLLRIATDGTMTGVVAALPGVEVMNPTLGPPQVFGGDEVTVVYKHYADACATTAGLYAQRLGATGVALADPVPLGLPAQYSDGVASATTTNGSSRILLEAGDGHSLEVGWIKGGGKEAGVRSRIALDPSAFFESLSFVRRGSEGVAAWLVPSRPGIRLARVNQ